MDLGTDNDCRSVAADAALADGLLEASPCLGRVSPYLHRRLLTLGSRELWRRDAARRARIAARMLLHLS